jgi:hypothetical protein
MGTGNEENIVSIVVVVGDSTLRLTRLYELGLTFREAATLLRNQGEVGRLVWFVAACSGDFACCWLVGAHSSSSSSQCRSRAGARV